MCTESTFDKGIARAGGLTALATLLDESPQVVTNWRKRRVPPAKCKAFSAATGIGLMELRPDDWMSYWPELAEAA